MDKRTLENICTDVLVTWRTIFIRSKEINLNMPFPSLVLLTLVTRRPKEINLNMPLEKTLDNTG